MFLELQDDNVFKKIYFDVLKYQLTNGSLQLEGISSDGESIEQSLNIYNQLCAINYVFNGNMDYSHIGFLQSVCEIAKLVSGEEIVDFRKTQAEVNGSNVERSKAAYIRNDLMYLIDNYNYFMRNAKTNRERFEIEARFHIDFLHIHPFEDANGRTARIILTYNLAKNNLAPCIITIANKREYCDYIENGDFKGLANLFEELSKKELQMMISIYKDLDQKGLIDGNKMSLEQEDRYLKRQKYLVK